MPDQELGTLPDGGEATGTKVARIDEEKLSLIRDEIRKGANLSVNDWPDERLKVIANTVAPPNTTAQQLSMFLSVATKYNLDPFLGEIWLAKEEGYRKGNGDVVPDKIFILTGRDSFLAVAGRDPDYKGFDAGVVYENDTFEVERNGEEINVRHIISGFDRGERKGAFCVAYREGRRPVLTIRPWSQYTNLQNKKNWKNNPDDMMETRVITVSHRLLYRISGIYTEEEFVDKDFEDGKAIPLEEVAQGVQGTKDRIEELREAHKAKQAEVVEEEKSPPPAEKEAPGINVLACKVEFGKYKKENWTWGEAFENDKGVVGYIRHWVLEGEFQHPSLTPEVRVLLAEACNAHEEKNGVGAPQSDEDASGDQGDGEEAPQEAGGEDDVLSRLYVEADEAAVALAKFGELDPKDADEIELLKEEGDREGLARVRDRLNVRLKELLDGGADPTLGI